MQADYGQFPWYRQWCEPVIIALYKHNLESARNHLDLLKAAIDSGTLAPADETCLVYQHAYLRFQIHLTAKDKASAQLDLPDIEKQLNQPSMLPSAERMRIRLLLQLRVNLDRLSLKPLHPHECRRIAANLPKSEYNTELWFYLSGWAFRHCQLGILEEAYEYTVLQGSEFQANWAWQRINIMLKLVRGDGVRDDLLWLIDNISLSQHLRSLKRDIWPRAQELGLVDQALELRLLERDLELSQTSPARIDQMLTPYIQRNQGSPPQAFNAC